MKTANIPWWILAMGLVIAIFAGGAVLGVIFTILGALLTAAFTVLGVVFKLAFSVVGLVLGSLINVLFVGGLIYLGYRCWQSRSNNDVPFAKAYKPGGIHD